MTKDNKSNKSPNEEYFASIEHDLNQKAAKDHSLRNRLHVIQKPTREGEENFAPFYDVVHVNARGNAKRIGSFSGTDTMAMNIGDIIEGASPEDIKLILANGFTQYYRQLERKVGEPLNAIFQAQQKRPR